MSAEPGQIASASDVASRLAITDIIFLHSRGIDRLDVDILKACYWPEAEVDYGSFKGSAHQFAELVIPVLAEQYQLTQHALGNSLITLAPGSDSARAESYVTAYHLLPAGDEELVFSGRYLDVFSCRDNVWKLMHRQVVMDWSRRQAVVDERTSPAFADLAKGGGAKADPLYALLNR
ncbi:nuclear transport factor 2 family protein [Oceanicoccus sp. KOV_DT_Chl]|uniref:nuclear transport factor 2 family protein n=1 Tax=Oceanicoccus sp. KOV_DT_Chl TaxID=1904639 RepID=UPI000C7D062D|nr:nuclear transport factor 2 family protein [Oceanicoccus sp. KOV_DT_Chl]